jgi:putative phosphoribosyl transferase
MFRDRQEAGQRLGRELGRLGLREPVVLALPRGGVPVGVEIADALGAPLDLVVVQKIGAPGNPELAAAAIVDGDPVDVVLNREIIEAYKLDDDELAELVRQGRPELERRRLAYRGTRRAVDIKGKTAILVDDGVATGTSMKVAIRAMKHRGPREIMVAIPVAPRDALDELGPEANRIVCLERPPHFRALSYYYRNFKQLTDSEVMGALEDLDRRRKAARSAKSGG